MAKQDDPGTSVTFKSASVASTSIKKGEITVSFKAPLDERAAGQVGEVADGRVRLMGTVTIKGKQAQLALKIADKPPKDEE
jgi:hypothetical protein